MYFSQILCKFTLLNIYNVVQKFGVSKIFFFLKKSLILKRTPFNLSKIK